MILVTNETIRQTTQQQMERLADYSISQSTTIIILILFFVGSFFTLQTFHGFLDDKMFCFFFLVTSITNQSINQKPDHLHFEYSGTSISSVTRGSMTGWPSASNEQQRGWRERRMTGGGGGGFMSHHHHYNNYYYYCWCKEKCVVVCCGVHATVISIPSYHYLFIIVITITIGHGVIILIVLSVAATHCG